MPLLLLLITLSLRRCHLRHDMPLMLPLPRFTML